MPIFSPGVAPITGLPSGHRGVGSEGFFGAAAAAGVGFLPCGTPTCTDGSCSSCASCAAEGAGVTDASTNTAMTVVNTFRMWSSYFFRSMRISFSFSASLSSSPVPAGNLFSRNT